MKVTILGCGASYGVPSLLKGFGKCDPQNPKNTRLRSSILIEEQGHTLLIDTPPEIRLELLRTKVKKIDALLYTHCHYDHIAGAEDVRNYTSQKNQVLDIYGTRHDLSAFKKEMSFIFNNPVPPTDLALHPLRFYTPFTIKGIGIIPIKQYHGLIFSVGYRIGKFAYSTDVKSMDQKGFELLKGIDTWVVECTTDHVTPGHVTLKEVLEWIQYIHPKKAYLTHLGTEWDYETLSQKLPPHTQPAYDGMEIKC